MAVRGITRIDHHLLGLLFTVYENVLGCKVHKRRDEAKPSSIDLSRRYILWLKYCRYGVKHFPINQSIDLWT